MADRYRLEKAAGANGWMVEDRGRSVLLTKCPRVIQVTFAAYGDIMTARVDGRVVFGAGRLREVLGELEA